MNGDLPRNHENEMHTLTALDCDSHEHSGPTYGRNYSVPISGNNLGVGCALECDLAMVEVFPSWSRGAQLVRDVGFVTS